MVPTSRKQVAVTMLLCGVLFTRAAVSINLCSCSNTFRSEHPAGLCDSDVSIDTQRCDGCGENKAIELVNDRCVSQQMTSTVNQHLLCQADEDTNIRLYRCHTVQGTITCTVPKFVERRRKSYVAVFTTLLLKYSLDFSRPPRTLRWERIMYRNIENSITTLENGCAKMDSCIRPYHMLHNSHNNLTLAFEVTESHMETLSDVFISMVYIQACNRSNSHTDPNRETVSRFQRN
ncbi:uncharacterized protein [Argopecten irradians]|uniref:uncharacterized protein n=1 Tax=Argopecten irradians TaxID=31199 RepID=UPI003717E934